MKNSILTKSNDALYFAGAKITKETGTLRRKSGPKKGFKNPPKSSQLEPYSDFLDMAGDLDWPI